MNDITHTFVTCFYDLSNYENRDFDSNFYIDIGIKFFNMFKNDDNIKFVMYTDKLIHDRYGHLFKDFKNLKLYVLEIEDFYISKILDEVNLTFPKNKKNTKDTYNFFKLMLSKTFFLEKTIDNTNDTHYSWIDFGILKIIKEEHYDLFYDSIKKISSYNNYNIKFPSIKEWYDFYVNNEHNNTDYRNLNKENDHIVKNYPSWLFLGGLLIGSRDSLLIFIKEVNNFINRMKELKYIIWEVNVWSYIYLFHCKEIMTPYFSDNHDIKMFSNF
jgi:hypothetical protein